MLYTFACVQHVTTPLRRLSRWPTLHRTILTLAIETSCDDTCVALVSKSEKREKTLASLLFNERITHRNTGKGGIVPVEALVSHRLNLPNLVDKSLSALPTARPDLAGEKTLRLRDGDWKQKPDLVSVTRGPGMKSSLAVGVGMAQGLATAWQVPLVGVHHMQAHALTSRLVDAMGKRNSEGSKSIQPAFPFLTLLVSGGHTMLVHSKSLVDHSILATTRDIAIGDELDKCGRLILPKELLDSTPDTSYAKYLSTYAFKDYDFQDYPVPVSRTEEIDKPVNKYGWTISAPMARSRDLAFSFAGISSTVKRIQSARTGQQGLGNQGMSEEERVTLARTAIGTAFDSLGSRIVIALEMLRKRGVEISTLVVSGGVAANDFLRYHLRQSLDVRDFGHVGLNFPPVALCTDNAAMIGWAGIEMFEAGHRSELGFQPTATWSMDSNAEDGGILGIGGGEPKQGQV